MAYDRAPILVLHPLSRLRLYWDLVVSICALVSLVETPMRVAFHNDGFGYTAGEHSARCTHVSSSAAHEMSFCWPPHLLLLSSWILYALCPSC